MFYDRSHIIFLEGEITDTEFIDVRPAASFEKGHPHGFKNAHYSNYLNEDNSAFKSREEIIQAFKDDGIDLTKKIVFSCEAGVTACISEVAAKIAGCESTSIYDGSMQEYAKHGKPEFLN